MVSCLYGFIFSGNANYVTSYVIRNNLVIGISLSIIVKKIKTME